MYIDSHAHLFFTDYENDLEEVIQRAQDAGVTSIINPGTDLLTSLRSIELAEKYEMIYACVGFHPHDASKADDAALAEIESLASHPKVVAIGEIGLDYHYNYSPPDQQRKIFALQIDIASRQGLPIVIHSREAEPDTLSIVGEKTRFHSQWKIGLPKGVFHCFPGDVTMAQEVIGWGYFISIPGPITFPGKLSKPNSMVAVVEAIPMEYMLLETDSPFLSPVPNRGKRNEPSNIPLIAQRIADVKQCSIEEVGRVSTLGVKKLFGVPHA